MSSKKAQLGLIELLMVVVILGILIAAGMYTYFRFFKVDLEQTQEELYTQETNTLLALAASMPELECSRAGSTTNCVDATKALALQSLAQDQEVRTTLVERFGFRSVYVEVLYPQPPARACAQGTYPDCSHYVLLSNKPASYTSVANYSVITPLYYPESQTTKVALLTLEVYGQ